MLWYKQSIIEIGGCSPSMAFGQLMALAVLSIFSAKLTILYKLTSDQLHCSECASLIDCRLEAGSIDLYCPGRYGLERQIYVPVPSAIIDLLNLKP